MSMTTEPVSSDAALDGDGTDPMLEPYRTSLRVSLKEAWRHRHVARGLAAQYLTLRRPNMILGYWWFPIRLVFNSVAMAFIFGSVLSVPSAPGVPYFLYVTGGAMSWWIFDRGTRTTMRSFHTFRKYVANLAFPLVLVPFAGAAALLVPLGFIALFLGAVLLVYLGIDGRLYLDLPEALLLMPLSLVWLVLAAIAVGLLTGPVFVRIRDVRQVFRLALPFWMFLTPVVYPMESLSGWLRTAVLANPLTPPVLLFKEGFLGTAGPPAWSVASRAALTALFLGGALWFTNRFGPAILTRGEEPDDEEDSELA